MTIIMQKGDMKKSKVLFCSANDFRGLMYFSKDCKTPRAKRCCISCVTRKC